MWRVGWETGQRGSVGSDTEPESWEGLGCLPERVEPGRGAWWGSGGQAQVGENLDDHRGVFNGREEGQGAAALRTGGEVDGEELTQNLFRLGRHLMQAVNYRIWRTQSFQIWKESVCA